jgi:hypothetical protein
LCRLPEPEDLIRICRPLNDAGAHYVLIGGLAVVAHGASGFTMERTMMTSLVRMGIAPVQPIAERRTKCHNKARRPHEDEENAEDCGEFGEGHE